MTTLARVRHNILKTPLRAPLVWVRHRSFAPADAFVAAYPRSGSTWLRFLLAELLSGQGSQFGTVNELIPQVGHHQRSRPILPGGGRLIKTHESYRSQYRRTVYLVRDARDVALSEHAYQTALGIFHGGFDQYLVSFLSGNVNGYGAWHKHVASWLDSPLVSTGNLLLVKFDDLRLKTAATLKSILDFLNVEIDGNVIHSAVEANSLERMRAKEKHSPQRASKRGQFVRSGAVGGWRERYSPDQLALVDRYAGTQLRRLGYPTLDQSMMCPASAAAR